MTVTETPRARGTRLKDGRVVAIAGPVVDVEFPRGSLPEINTAVELTISLDGDETRRHRRGRPADRRQPRARRRLKPTDGLTRAHAGAQHRPRHQRAGRRRHARPRLQRHRRAARTSESVDGHRRALGHPPRGAGVRHPRAQGRGVPDRHQGHRPAHPLRAGRQDRPVRRRRRGQDRAHPGDDQPGRHPARWCVGVRRRGRAHP